MKIALDYDDTYTLDPKFWWEFISNALRFGIDIRIVTARSSMHDNIGDEVLGIPIIYCDGIAKRYVCREIHDWVPDVWVDDKPEAVDCNAGYTEEWLANWRATRA